MSNKEKFFPLNTVGGKIRKLRKEAGLSGSQLYDLVYQISGRDCRAGSDASKEKTIYNWESGTTQLDYETMKAVCKTLNCSADYLLGLDECTNKTAQFIQEKTGLSETVISKLCYYHEHINFQSYTQALNIILKSLNFESALLHIKKYMDTVKSVLILQQKREERLRNVFSGEPDSIVNGKPVYNWPYTDNLDKNYKEKETEMLLEEYTIDKSFKYIIQEIERIAKGKAPDTN